MTVQRRVRLGLSGCEAVIRADPFGAGWVLEFDGVEQSHVDLADPFHIRHEYLRRIANALDALAASAEPIRVLHLGAGALTLPRYIQATRPGSPQTVVEIERELLTLVRDVLPLPPGTDLTDITADARDALALLSGPGATAPERFDAIVLDVFTGEDSPTHLANVDFYDEALAALTADGILLVNVGDEAGLLFASAQIRALDAASARIGVDGVHVLCDTSTLDGRVAGNLVLLAGPGASGARAVGIANAVRDAGPHPGAVLEPHDAVAFADRMLRRAG